MGLNTDSLGRRLCAGRVFVDDCIVYVDQQSAGPVSPRDPPTGRWLLHPSWHLCVYKRMLESENKILAKEGVTHFLQLHEARVLPLSPEFSEVRQPFLPVLGAVVLDVPQFPRPQPLHFLYACVLDQCLVTYFYYIFEDIIPYPHLLGIGRGFNFLLGIFPCFLFYYLYFHHVFLFWVPFFLLEPT